MSIERPFQPEHFPVIDFSPRWKPSNTEPLHRVLLEGSQLHRGVDMLDKVLFACSNTELKSVMLFYGLDGSATHMNDIHPRIKPLLPDSWSKEPQPYNIARVMRTFMCPPGFVQEPIEHHFAITALGEGAGKESAAFLLKKAVELGVSMGNTFQERTEDDGDNPTRAYITRIAALIALKEGASSQVKLFEKLGGSVGVLAQNLRALSSKKLIEYDAVSPEVKGQYVFERANLAAMPPKAGILYQNVYKYFEANDAGNKYTIAKALGRDETQNIAKALSQLVKAGVIKPGKWIWTEQQSDAKITPLGERLIDEVIIPLLSAYSGDEQALQILAQARSELEKNPALAVEALDQYKIRVNRTPEIQTQQRILALVKDRGPQRRNQIIADIGYKAHPQLIELVNTGQLKRVRDGNASFYIFPDSQGQPKRNEEVIIFEFNPPVDLFDKQEHRKIDEYRRELGTVEFWQKLSRELQHVPAERYTARSFFLQYDPQYKDWPQRWYNGIFANHIRALWDLGETHPWEFIRSYKPDNTVPELQAAIQTAQDLINKVLPLETNTRIFNKRYIDRLEGPEFWAELSTDVKSVPVGTKIESFLLRFDPNEKGRMKPGHQYGKYYPFRCNFKKYMEGGPVRVLTTYRPPQDTPIETKLAIREAQVLLRQHLVIRGVSPDDFSDVELLRRQRGEELLKKEIRDKQLLLLKSFYSEFQEFNESEVKKLSSLTANSVQIFRSKIKGYDADEASLATIGFETTGYDNKEVVAIFFPTELRAAFLVHAFEQWRLDRKIPQASHYKGPSTFTNAEVKGVLTTLERYLTHYENQLKKKNPDAILTTAALIKQLKNYVQLAT